MSYPSVAIVGRPNVGKSTLFNRLVGSRIAIEDQTPGVTRDRLLYPLTLEDRTFDLIDTGGIGMVDRQDLSALVAAQITVAIDAAAALVFLVDSRDGITPLDQDVAARLRRVNKPVLLVANKVDTLALEDALPSFHALGFGDALPVSAKQKRNLDQLEEALLEILPPPAAGEEPLATRDLLKIAFTGRRNVGKSSIVNALAGSERVIVSDTPGTTRDSLDIIIERDGEKFVAIDTAGMRKRGQLDDAMEFYAHLRTERAIRRADVVVLLLDVMDEISKVDKRIGQLIVEEYKPCIIALNKWDLAKEADPGVTVETFQKYLNDNLAGLWFCPLAGVSAKAGENIWGLVRAARRLARQAARPVKTGALNKALAGAYAKRRPKPLRGKIGKIYYGTQIDTSPPTILIFCNNPRVFDDNYRRYLQGQLRQALGFDEVPVKLAFRVSPGREAGRYETDSS